MRFTERDGQLLRWINGHGFVTLRQIARWLGSSYQAGQRRVLQLVDYGYLDRRWLIHGDRTHWLTQSGRDLCGDDLSPPRDIQLGSYRHDHMLVDLGLKLVACTSGHFTPERRLRQILVRDRFGRRRHVADGWLHVGAQDKPIAIELELSTKGTRRLDKIMRDHALNLDISQVWYFVESNGLRRHLTKAADGYSFIKIHDLPTNIAESPRSLVGDLVQKMAPSNVD